jgi:stage V sporulation protein D (sporulation-specific penicillin-binding protein)
MGKPGVNNTQKIKIYTVFGIIFAAFVLLVVRLYRIQIEQGQFFLSKALAQQLRPTTISAKRGNIYDRNLNRLAVSSPVWTVVLSPAELGEQGELEMIAGHLSQLLEIPRQSIIEKGQKTKSYYEIIKQQTEKNTADAVAAWIESEGLRSVYLVEESRRYYPYGSLAATVLGFVNRDQSGAYGLESYYESLLAGTPGLALTEKTALRGDMPYQNDKIHSPIDGRSLVLTIDEGVQSSLERHMRIAIDEFDVKRRATGIVMDVNTGAILAMSNQPDFDPNRPSELADPRAVERINNLFLGSGQGDDVQLSEQQLRDRKQALEQEWFLQWQNKAVNEPYEPGSVFKVITAAAALESDAVTGHGQYYTCTGSLTVAGRIKSCWKPEGHGTIDFYQAVKYSCNPAFMMVAKKLGAERFDGYFKRFGLTDLTGIDIPGEAEGVYYQDLVALDAMSEEYLASSSFGQSFKVTPIQMITAVSACVNGGRLMQPYVVDRVLDADGRVESYKTPTLIRNVISQETSSLIADMLLHSVSDHDASGRFAYVPGYRVGGKTGTSEKLELARAGQDAMISSFLGIAPADDPQIAVLILLDEPYIKSSTGAVAAAPVVGAVMSDILPMLGIKPVYTPEERAAAQVALPKLSGKLVHDAVSELTRLSLSYSLEGGGSTVVAHYPAEKTLCPRGSSVILYTEQNYTPAKLTVPDTLGMSAQQARRTLQNAGFNVDIINPELENTGAHVVGSQPEPGSFAQPADIVGLELG